MSNVSKSALCEVCYVSNLKSCLCKNKISTSVTHVQSTSEDSTIVNKCLEATLLQDLPGNSVAKFKSKLDADTNDSNPVIKERKVISGATQDVIFNTTSISMTNSYDVLPTSVTYSTSMAIQVPQATKAHCMDSKQKMEEFNNILNLVCNKSVTNDKLCDNLVSNAITNRVSNDGSFNEFASGIYGTNQDKVTRVPDSSTSEMVIQQAPNSAKETLITNIKGPPKQVAHQTNLYSPSNVFLKSNTTTDDIQIRNRNAEINKNIDGKIRILSDVKFDKKVPCNTAMSLNKNNATSTPSYPMRTLVINGTPAIGQNPPIYNYSKDEIMAMPTFIIVPTTGSIVSASSTTCMQNAKNIPASEPTKLSPKRGPLYIEVPQNEATIENNCPKENIKANEVGLVKTVNTMSHASLPKDNTVLSKTSTPQVHPPLRKSSSTPRRTSHVRVLDFATPRRILDKVIPEKENSSLDTVVVVTDSPVQNTPAIEKDPINKPSGENILNVKKKDQKVVSKKRNWDEELRALVETNEKIFPSYVAKTVKKTKKQHHNKTQTKLAQSTNENTGDDKKITTKVKKSKGKVKNSVEIEESKSCDLKSDKPVKPTINIITAVHGSSTCAQEHDKKKNKSSDNENQIDTPENERLLLQNEIGGKLNISDLLETPYKQAIYDIQMETPRFLGPDLPGEPISDIKIMNIPTPRFFDTPKPPQATPSSYSSRPTDYSSGGSYYKPDDQDYIPITEVMECKITDAKSKDKKVSKSKEASQKENLKESSTDTKSTKSKRPVRKCTKNVSYYNSPKINSLVKAKQTSDDEETEYSNNSNTRDNSLKHTKDKTAKSKSVKTRNKLEKHKSPFKKETPKHFMKIKPRRVTPVRDIAKSRKKSPDTSSALKKKPLKEKTLTTVAQSITVGPTKSRRKSSTPRKLHCNKTFNSSTSSNTSLDVPDERKTDRKDVNICITHDSDSEQQPLRWSDDGSQDGKYKDNDSSVKENDDIIIKIQQYIETMDTKIITTTDSARPPVGSLQNDLIKRGFDIETAKIIERDLLDTPPLQDGAVQSTSNDNNENDPHAKENLKEHISKISPIANDNEKEPVGIDEEASDDIDDLDFSVTETNEESSNYFEYKFDESNYKHNEDTVKLKEKFCMEVCIDDGVSIRLRSTQLNVLVDEVPSSELSFDKKEIETAVSSISNIEKLYTPIKDRREQCYELFDSTLTSLDTPLNKRSPKESPKGKDVESSITEIVLEVENISSKAEGKKRKRVQSGASDEGALGKKAKSDNQYLLNPASIQNIDIESVLSKLHGP